MTLETKLATDAGAVVHDWATTGASWSAPAPARPNTTGRARPRRLSSGRRRRRLLVLVSRQGNRRLAGRVRHVPARRPEAQDRREESGVAFGARSADFGLKSQVQHRRYGKRRVSDVRSSRPLLLRRHSLAWSAPRSPSRPGSRRTPARSTSLRSMRTWPTSARWCLRMAAAESRFPTAKPTRPTSSSASTAASWR